MSLQLSKQDYFLSSSSIKKFYTYLTKMVILFLFIYFILDKLRSLLVLLYIENLSCSNICFFSWVYSVMPLSFSVSVSPFMLAKPEFRSETRVGNCTVWNMESNPTVRCPVTRPSAVEMTRSTLSLVKPGLENTFRGLCLLTWNQL